MTQEDKDNFCNAVRAEVKQAGMMDTTDNCWDFFINKVRPSVSKLQSFYRRIYCGGNASLLHNQISNSNGMSVGNVPLQIRGSHLLRHM